MTKVNFITKDDQLLRDLAKKVLTKFKSKKIPEWLFDMRSFAVDTCSVHKCGTAHCIGGWMDLENGGDGTTTPRWGMSLTPAVHDSSENLFFNFPSGANRKGAIRAMKRFIAGKENPWAFKLRKDEYKKGYKHETD